MGTLTLAAVPVNEGTADLIGGGFNALPLLSKEYQTPLRRGGVMNTISNTQPKKFVAGLGSTMRIPIMPQVRSTRALVNYTNTWEAPEPDYIDVTVDRLRKWDFPTFDAQNVQSQITNYGQTWATNAGVNTSEDIEAEIIAELPALILAANQGATAGAISQAINLGTTTVPRTVATTEASNFVLDAILEGGAVLGEQGVPNDGQMYVVCGDLLMTRIKSSLRKANEMGDSTSVLRRGVVGTVDNKTFLNCFRMPSCTKVNDKPVMPVLFVHKMALAYHVQADKVEKIRLQNTMGDGYRSEVIYGYKIVQPKAIAWGYFTTA